MDRMSEKRMIISDEENKTITFANCRCITINIVDCRKNHA